MNLAKRTGSNLAWVLLSDIIAKGSILFATIYLARILGPAHFGMFSLGVAIANSLWPLVDVGTTGYGIREIARYPERASAILSSLGSFRLTISVAVTILGIAFFFLMYGPVERSWILSGGLLYLVCFGISPDWFLRGLERMKELLFINSFTALFFIASIVLFVHLPADAAEASFLRSLSFGVGSVFGFFLIYRMGNYSIRYYVNFSEWREVFSSTHSFMLNRIAANLVQYLPFFVVSLFLTEETVGLFAAPHRLYIVFLAGIAAIGAAVYPVLSSVYHNNIDKFAAYQRLLLQIMLMLFLPIAGLGYLSAEAITLLLFGEGYAQAGDILWVMMLAVPVAALRAMYMYTLFCSGNERSSYPVTFVSLFLQLILALWLVPTMGNLGAAYALLAGELVCLVLLWRICIRKAGVISLFDLNFAVLLGLNLLLVAMAKALTWDLLDIFLFGIPLYAILLLLCGQLRLRELQSLLKSDRK